MTRRRKLLRPGIPSEEVAARIRPTLVVERLAQAWNNHESGHSGGCTSSGCLPEIVAEYGRLSNTQPCPQCIEIIASGRKTTMLYHHWAHHGVPLPGDSVQPLAGIGPSSDDRGWPGPSSKKVGP